MSCSSGLAKAASEDGVIDSRILAAFYSSGLASDVAGNDMIDSVSPA